MLVLNQRALCTTAFLAMMLGAARLHTQDVVNAIQGPVRESETSDRALQEIGRLFYDGQHGAVVNKVDRFRAAHALALENIGAEFFKAESQFQLGQIDAAVRTYQSALASAETLANNVTRRRFAPVHFRVAQILRQQRLFDAAIAQVEAGLRLAPQAVDGQIFLGHLLTESGDRHRALEHYRRQLASSLPAAEERAVLGIKADRLAYDRPGASITPPDLGAASIYANLSIGIVPVNHIPAAVNWQDVCVILQASWFIECHVLPPLALSDATILDRRRNQYAADEMLTEIERRMSRDGRSTSHILAVTDRDIFAPRTSFVFSWQQRNEANAVGVLSTSRFTTDIPEYYEPDIVATRRVALQALSTTGSMLGFTRPTDPECPLAYPESFREFQYKRLRLCPSEQQQRDQLLGRRGGAARRLTRMESVKIASVYQKYFID